jgi:hypothetical protein
MESDGAARARGRKVPDDVLDGHLRPPAYRNAVIVEVRAGSASVGWGVAARMWSIFW